MCPHSPPPVPTAPEPTAPWAAGADPTAPTAAALSAALQALRAAHRRAPNPSLAQRRAWLLALQRFVREHQAALIAAIAADYGHRSHDETRLLEIFPVVDGIAHALRHLAAWMRPQRRAVDWRAFPLARNRVIAQPLGVVGIIVPWNFPLNLSLLPLAYALAAGNRVMIKMSENSRHLAAYLIAHLPAALGADVLRVFDETGDVGVAFSALPFDHLLFTGSGSTGRAVMAAAARNLCPVTLELGGKSPALIAPDFDPATAAARIAFVKCLNAGQICTTVDHVWLPQGQQDAFVAALRAWVRAHIGRLDSPDYTAIIDARAFARLTAALDEARARGAQVLALLDGPACDAASRKIAPHVVIDAPADCALMTREIFGPILPLRTYAQLDTAIEAINAGPRPLAVYPFSHHRPTVARVLEQVMSGGVSVNDALFHVGQHDLPFGGVGESGMGHYHGREGFTTFSKLRPVFYQARWSTAWLLWPPYGARLRTLLRWLIAAA